MLGYYGLPEETARALRNGWLHTGDVGRLDADGFLYVVERKKDLIIRGGFNVYPREVEDVLYAHPAVAEAKYKCPREVRFLPSLPKNPLGKILRKELRALVG